MCAAAPSLQAAAPVARGDVVFESGFEGSNGLAGWHGAGALDRGWRGEQSARVESQSGGPSMIELTVPRVSQLLADPAFDPLAQWLTQRQVNLDELQAAVDNCLDQARKAVIPSS